MKMPSLSGLRAFDAAARLGSFKAAAGELQVTPTAISHQVRALEEQLGFSLFTREVRKIRLTKEGLELSIATNKAFSTLTEALSSLGESGNRVSLSTTPAFAALWMVPRVKDFEELHPGFSINVATSTKTTDLSRDRSVDLVIRYGTGHLEEGMYHRLLFTEKIGAFGSPQLLSKSDLTEMTLLETRWQNPELPRVTWDHWLKKKGFKPEDFTKRRQFDEEQHVLQAGLAGQGLILISCLLVEEILAKGWLEPFDTSYLLDGLSYYILATKERSRARKNRIFLKWLLDQAVEERGVDR